LLFFVPDPECWRYSVKNFYSRQWVSSLPGLCPLDPLISPKNIFKVSEATFERRKNKKKNNATQGTRISCWGNTSCINPLGMFLVEIPYKILEPYNNSFSDFDNSVWRRRRLIYQKYLPKFLRWLHTLRLDQFTITFSLVDLAFLFGLETS
jgi:hypothetical protein